MDCYDAKKMPSPHALMVRKTPKGCRKTSDGGCLEPWANSLFKPGSHSRKSLGDRRRRENQRGGGSRRQGWRIVDRRGRRAGVEIVRLPSNRRYRRRIEPRGNVIPFLRRVVVALPGGNVEPDEHPRATVAGELQEELGTSLQGCTCGGSGNSFRIAAFQNRFRI